MPFHKNSNLPRSTNIEEINVEHSKSIFHNCVQFTRREKNFSEKSMHLFHNISEEIRPGQLPTQLETRVIARMKELGLEKAKKANWEESHCVLKKVLQLQEATLSRESPEVSHTIHCIGVALNWLGHSEAALLQLDEALRLRQRVLGNDHLDVAATHYIIGSINGKTGNYEHAIYHLKLARDIEIKNLGGSLKPASQLIKDFELARTFLHKKNYLGKVLHR